MSRDETFADYLLNEKDLSGKMDILDRTKRILNGKKGIPFYFNNSTILKAETARMFLKYTDLKNQVDPNIVLTTCLTCNCKKVDGPQTKESLYSYAEKGAELLEDLGFNKRFCKICKQVNRYGEEGTNEKREPEADILELVDQFGGLILDRPERQGYTPKNAVDQIETNLQNQGKENRYFNVFKNFVVDMDDITIENNVQVPVFLSLKKMCQNENTREIINKNLMDFEEKADSSYYRSFKISDKNIFSQDDLNDLINTNVQSQEKIDKIHKKSHKLIDENASGDIEDNKDSLCSKSRSLFSDNAEEEVQNLQKRLKDGSRIEIER